MLEYEPMNMVTVDGMQFTITPPDVSEVDVMDEGLTNDDYIDAKYILITTWDGDEFLIDIWDDQNWQYREYILDLFDTM